MIYLQLLWAFFIIGLASFGGGYAAMSLIQAQVVSRYGWLTAQGFADLVTLSEMTPGPVAINAATFVGMRAGGPLGALVATLGCVLPACAITGLLFFLYNRYQRLNLVQGALGGIRPVVLALVAYAALTLTITATAHADWLALTCLGAGFVALRKGWVGPMGLIGCAAALGLALWALKLA